MVLKVGYNKGKAYNLKTKGNDGYNYNGYIVLEADPE